MTGNRISPNFDCWSIDNELWAPDMRRFQGLATLGIPIVGLSRLPGVNATLPGGLAEIGGGSSLDFPAYGATKRKFYLVADFANRSTQPKSKFESEFQPRNGLQLLAFGHVFTNRE
ncbi:hypothetical protein C7S18_04190 [Ahniella affigens]|uniref:Uncharacterized protein n=1 Tax=Ahniella affigens TaxID=2021234 RepID=A0A2P1PNM3_9GAMM|nr:hypothetical protein C7S18_04190 [Ahniella affigens]